MAEAGPAGLVAAARVLLRAVVASTSPNQNQTPVAPTPVLATMAPCVLRPRSRCTCQTVRHRRFRPNRRCTAQTVHPRRDSAAVRHVDRLALPEDTAALARLTRSA